MLCNEGMVNIYLKVIRAVERYVDSAKTEEYILKFLDAKDRTRESKIVRFIEAFE